MQKLKRQKAMLNKYLSFSFIILSVLILSACSTTQQTGVDNSSTKTYSADYLQAISLMKKGKLKSANILLRTVIKQQPNFSNAHVNLGIIHLKSKAYDEAENSFQYALKIKPDNIYAYNQLGVLYRQQGKFIAAKTAYKKAIDINSDYAFAHLNLGILFDLYLYDFSSAIEEYKEYQELMPKKDKQVNKWIIDLERRYKKLSNKSN